MRIRHKVNVIISEDTAGKDKLLFLDDALSEVVLDGPQEANVGKAEIAAEAAFAVPMGAVGDCRGVFLVMSAACTVTINDGDPLPVQLGVKAEEGGTLAANTKFFFEGLVTEVIVTAGADDDVTLKYAVWGDPAE